ncbi:histamine H2 receptor [Lingula anatina]|uniref:Histamine H2 receptor n=1 Tax=Lingula anatina TaxID=7574 RepID=A0A1S3HFU3_LINAN|nr:histamine H2 receptor [Lingula anatina]XP_013384342.1 histamine H2 receptor [Lingula anatina]XP_013384351.1 histamine H2 receptor [Lingula anatina]|eukprot:XP_013384333.1 histamine H2 receptor [Lingula anatina]
MAESEVTTFSTVDSGNASYAIAEPETIGNQTSIPTGTQVEAYYLFITAGVGLCFNLVLILSIFLSSKTRKMTSAFIIHGILLDLAKLYYCVPFALSLLQKQVPSHCNILGASFVTLISISAYNLVAMVAAEAYAFRDVFGDSEKGTFCCVLFGVLTVYIASVIIHLGPTVIGGNFRYNEEVGNCIYSKNELKSYVSYIMWVGINSLAVLLALYYAILLYRQILANKPHRINTLVRQAIALSKERMPKQNMIKKIVDESLSRVRVMLAVITCFIICWYPLFLLNISDPNFTQDKSIYKIFTIMGYSNGAITPILFIIFDKNLSMIRRLFCCTKCRGDDYGGGSSGGGGGGSGRAGMTPLMQTPGPSFQSQVQMYQRVGCRLCREGQSHPEELCNGGYRHQGRVTRDPSFCDYGELHEYTSVC